MRVLVRLSPADIPRLENVSLDGVTLLFALGTSLVTGVIFGVGPTVVAWHRGGETVLREQARGSTAAGGTRLRSMLTAAEVAFALIILVGAGLMLRSFTSLLAADLGFQPGGVSTFHIGFSDSAIDRSESRRRHDQNLRAIRHPRRDARRRSTSLGRRACSKRFHDRGIPSRSPDRAVGHLRSHDVAVPPGDQRFRSRAVTSPTATAPPPARCSYLARAGASQLRRPRSLRHRIRVEDTLWTIVGVVGDIGFGRRAPRRPSSSCRGPRVVRSTWVAVKSTVEPRRCSSPFVALHGVDPSFTPRDLAAMDDVVSTRWCARGSRLWQCLARSRCCWCAGDATASRAHRGIGLRSFGAPPRSVVGLGCDAGWRRQTRQKSAALALARASGTALVFRRPTPPRSWRRPCCSPRWRSRPRMRRRRARRDSIRSCRCETANAGRFDGRKRHPGWGGAGALGDRAPPSSSGIARFARA